MKANPETGRTLLEAIKHEIEGREFYLALAERVRNPLVRRKILGLAEDELEHRETLSRLYWAQTGTEVGEIEGHEPKGHLPDVGSMNLEELLEMAMETEKTAAATYLRMAGEAEDLRTAGFLEYLAEFEQGHYDTLAGELDKIRKTPGWENQGPSD